MSEKSILWVWDFVPAATSYQYRYAEGTSIPRSTPWTGITAREITLTNLKFSTEYVIEVRGLNDAGTGPGAMGSAVTSPLPTESELPPQPTITNIAGSRNFISVLNRLDNAYFLTVEVSSQRDFVEEMTETYYTCLLYTSPSPRDS